MQETTRYTILKKGHIKGDYGIDEDKFSQIAEEVRIKAINHIRDEKPEAFSAPSKSRDYLRASVRRSPWKPAHRTQTGSLMRSQMTYSVLAPFSGFLTATK